MHISLFAIHSPPLLRISVRVFIFAPIIFLGLNCFFTVVCFLIPFQAPRFVPRPAPVAEGMLLAAAVHEDRIGVVFVEPAHPTAAAGIKYFLHILRN